jgi:hypothetical protein
MLTLPIRSSDILDRFGISYTALTYLLRNRHISTPARDSSGTFVWTDENVEEVRQALAKRRKASKAELASA